MSCAEAMRNYDKGITRLYQLALIQCVFLILFKYYCGPLVKNNVEYLSYETSFRDSDFS
jgi:hypothetical protein